MASLSMGSMVLAMGRCDVGASIADIGDGEHFLKVVVVVVEVIREMQRGGVEYRRRGMKRDEVAGSK